MIFEEPPERRAQAGHDRGLRAATRRRASARPPAWTPPARRAEKPPRMPRSMPRPPRRRCAACRSPPACWPSPRRSALAACGDEEPGVDEPAREGLAIELDGVDYTVFITRELNPSDHAGQRLRRPTRRRRARRCYGVFLQVCNNSERAARRRPASSPSRTTRTTASSPSRSRRTTVRLQRRARSTRRSASPRPAASPSWAQPPARCCSSSSRWRTPRTAARAGDRGQDGEKRTFELDI